MSNKADWFVQSKFGIFMHYGLYSQIGRGEWTLYQEKIPFSGYTPLAKQFNPNRFDANRLARIAKEAGAGYLVLTSRHHDGFCLFNSKVSDFNSMQYCGRDLIAEHIDACRTNGLKIGVYYSLLDWRFLGYHNRKKYPESLGRMVAQAHSQVRELLTNYGEIDYLWFDGGWFPDLIATNKEKAERIAKIWRANELIDMIHSLQPGILTNDRSGFPGDVFTPEQKTQASKDSRYSEACMTIGDRWGWGYIRNNPNIKSSRSIMQHMIIQASLGGNFLLNLGLCPDGSSRDNEELILSELGQWLRINGESLYGTTAPPPSLLSIIGEFTANNRDLYFHVFRWPSNGCAVLSGLHQEVESVCLLESSREYPFTQEQNGRLIIRNLPYLAPDSRNTVLKIHLTGEPLKRADETYGFL